MNVKRVNRILSMLYGEMRTLTDEGRELPVRWNVMHMYSSSQLAKIIALKRGIDPELASLAAALHDIAVIKTKRRENHALSAEPYVRETIHKYNDGSGATLPKITKEEEDILVNAIKLHGDKNTYSDDPFTELLKDVDSVDRYLHGVKTENDYLERCRRTLSGLGINI